LIVTNASVKETQWEGLPADLQMHDYAQRDSLRRPRPPSQNQVDAQCMVSEM